jgi:hypothetical protein
MPATAGRGSPGRERNPLAGIVEALTSQADQAHQTDQMAAWPRA